MILLRDDTSVVSGEPENAFKLQLIMTVPVQGHCRRKVEADTDDSHGCHDMQRIIALHVCHYDK